VIRAAGGALLERAQAAGSIRTDTDVDDVLKLVHGVAAATENDPDRAAQAERLLGLILDGLRVQPART